jgi:hypothetical protein
MNRISADSTAVEANLTSLQTHATNIFGPKLGSS